MFFVNFLIETAKKIDRFQVLAPAEFIRNPLALFAGVVEIKHGSDRIHAQAVDVIFVEPEHGARHQKAANLGAAVVEDVRLPVGMEALARVGVLVEMSAIEVGKAVKI